MTWHHFFRGRRSTLDKWIQIELKKRKKYWYEKVLVRGRQLCTQLSIFEGSLAELLRF